MPQYRSRQFALELAALLGLLAVVALRSQVQADIVFGDETGYLQAALAADSVVPSFPDGALYIDLYRAVSALTSDPIGAYFAMQAVSAVLFVLGFWVAARLLVGSLLAWSATAVLSALSVTYAWPAVSGFAAGAVLMGFALIARFRSFLGLGVAAGLFWVASASRPEYIWIASAISVVSVGGLVATITVKRVPSSWNAWQSAVVAMSAVGVPLALVLVHGSPFAGSRSWMAFAQHYALNNALPGEDPWLDSVIIVARDFSSADSIWTAIAANPGAIVSHVAANVLQTWWHLSSVFFVFPRPVAPFALLASAMFLTLIGSALAALSMNRRNLGARMLRVRVDLFDSQYPLLTWLVSVSLLLVAVATVVPVLSIYPRDHYLLAPVGLLILSIVGVQRWLGSDRLTLILPFAASLVLIAGQILLVLQATANRAVYPAPVAKTLSLMRYADRDWRVISDDWGVNASLSTFVPDADVIIPVGIPSVESIEDPIKSGKANGIWMSDNFVEMVDQEAERGVDFEHLLTDLNFYPIHPESRLWVQR